MENNVIEANYPITFRQTDADFLGQHLKNRHSVILIGMKRVGISNFLRFFLNHGGVIGKYIDNKNRHLFIPVDLNDMVEKEFYPFWILTLKRIGDATSKLKGKKSLNKYVEDLFLDSIQSKDTFKTLENIRKALVRISQEKIFPTIFFIRFDRIKDIVTPEFFGNLQGLKDATHHRLSYVFTSFRSLDKLSPSVFPKSSLPVFAQNQYMKPAQRKDIETIFESYRDRYKLSFSIELKNYLFELVDGYVQYLQLALICLHERNKNEKDKNDLFELLSKDERIILQSEELWESLDGKEKPVLLKVAKDQKITAEEKNSASYLWNTGFIGEKGIFSKLFSEFLKIADAKNVRLLTDHDVEFSKKENLLFNFLKTKIGEICEREEIIKAVWAEVEELGVSDWAIDRLVARLRSKLKTKKSPYEIVTVKTRGYKLLNA